VLATVVKNLAANLGWPITAALWAPAGHSSAVESTRRLALQAARKMGRVSDVTASQLYKGRIDDPFFIAPTSVVRFSTPFLSDPLAVAGKRARIASVWIHRARIDGSYLFRHGRAALAHQEERR
jgi:hypothetical protein